MMFGKKYVWQPTAISSGAAVALVTGLSVTVLVGAAPAAQARNVFLNGVDVSSSRSQELRNVQVRINEKGDEPWGNSYRDWSSNPSDYL